MCLILFALEQHPELPLIVAANRDEFFERPAKPATFWDDDPIYAGRDLSAGGTWLGINRNGDFAALTNYREPGSIHPEQAMATRGELPVSYLRQAQDGDALGDYLAQLETTQTRYNGYNLLFGSPKHLAYFSNRGHAKMRIPPGIYGLSNGLMDTPWPKVKTGKQALSEIIQTDLGSNTDTLATSLLTLLGDAQQAPDHQLPDTGVGLEWERTLSPRFIKGEHYGTRTSSVLLFHRDGSVEFHEHNYNSSGRIDNHSVKVINP